MAETSSATTAGDDLLTTLRARIRSKSWMWLFRRVEMEEGMRIFRARQVHPLRLQLNPANEAELAAAVAAGMFDSYTVMLLLRLGSSGELNLLTQCTCPTSSLCRHAAAVMLFADTEPGWGAIEAAQLAGTPKTGEAAETTAARVAPQQHTFSETVEISNENPVPVLRLRRVPAQRHSIRTGRIEADSEFYQIPVAEPLVEYAGCPQCFSLLARSPAHTWEDGDGQKLTLRRHLRAEKMMLDDLMEPVPLRGFIDVLPHLSTQAAPHRLLAVAEEEQATFWAHFIDRVVPELESLGWRMEIAPDFGFRIHEAEEEAWSTSLELDASGTDWFNFDLGVEIDGKRVSLVPVLIECIDSGLTPAALEGRGDQKFLLVLPEPGQPVLAIPARRLLVLLRFLEELLATRPARRDGRLMLDKVRAAQLQSLDGLPIRVPDEIAALAQRLRDFRSVQPAVPPRGLQAQLRPYQLEGLSWMQFLREFGLHGLLADDMGLGKTLQTLSHLLTEKEAGRADLPSLIVAPTSLLRNWLAEAARFTPDLRVLVLHGVDRKSDFRRMGRHDVVITSYPLLVRDEERLRAQEWHVVVLDEAQNIKNFKAKAAQVAGALKARHRVCLSGTPMENHLGELWSLFHFLMPGFLGDRETFRSYFRNPIEREQDGARQSQLAARVQPLLLRRTKDAVARELPPKTEIVQVIDLSKAQADLYETIRAVMDKRVREAIAAQGIERSQIVVLDALLKLRQVCCHPALLKQESARGLDESAKTSFLMDDLLPELVEEGRRVLMFSQFTEMLKLLEKRLSQAGIAYVQLTGDTRDRETPVRRFQKGEVPVFLISLKAGGAGLNLTAADTVIHYDPWWNPAVEAQASDRAHRIGQTKPVFVHKLICRGTIEERIVEMQRHKAALVEGLLSGQAGRLQLTQDEIRNLLAPLQ